LYLYLLAQIHETYDFHLVMEKLEQRINLKTLYAKEVLGEERVATLMNHHSFVYKRLVDRTMEASIALEDDLFVYFLIESEQYQLHKEQIQAVVEKGLYFTLFNVIDKRICIFEETKIHKYAKTLEVLGKKEESTIYTSLADIVKFSLSNCIYLHHIQNLIFTMWRTYKYVEEEVVIALLEFGKEELSERLVV